MRGEYRLLNGEVLHNSFTLAGIAGTLSAAFLDAYPAGLYIGLCSAIPAKTLTLADLQEPSIGVNGYARLALARNATSWPANGTQAGDPYIESEDQIFAASGGSFDVEITRMFLTPEATAVTGDVWALSAARQHPLSITTSTPIGDRSFNYRIYGM